MRETGTHKTRYRVSGDMAQRCRECQAKMHPEQDFCPNFLNHASTWKADMDTDCLKTTQERKA